MSSETPPRHLIFDQPSEVFATDSKGAFNFALVVNEDPLLDTAKYDEARLVFSLWHPSKTKKIDLDRAYTEIRGSFDPDEQHWIKLAEVEPVVPPYGAGETFDGWIVLPILAATSSYLLFGSGFEPRSRIQIRATAYFVV